MCTCLPSFSSTSHPPFFRVVQRNLVFVIGLSPRLADPEVLKRPEYFGKFGKIVKVVINNHTVYTGQQVGKFVTACCDLTTHYYRISASALPYIEVCSLM